RSSPPKASWPWWRRSSPGADHGAKRDPFPDKGSLRKRPQGDEAVEETEKEKVGKRPKEIAPPPLALVESSRTCQETNAEERVQGKKRHAPVDESQGKHQETADQVDEHDEDKR